MMYSDYVKQRILLYRRLGKSYVQISRCLSEEGYATTKVGVYKFVKRYEERGIISHSPSDMSYIVRSLYTYLRTSVANIPWCFAPRSIESKYGRSTNTGVVRIRAYKFKPTGVYACGYGRTDKYSRAYVRA